MIVVVAAVAVFAVAMIWYVIAREPRATTLSHADFDDAYDDLVAKGEIADDDREAAWQDFNARQVQEERERRTWEEGLDE